MAGQHVDAAEVLRRTTVQLNGLPNAGSRAAQEPAEISRRAVRTSANDEADALRSHEGHGGEGEHGGRAPRINWRMACHHAWTKKTARRDGASVTRTTAQRMSRKRQQPHGRRTIGSTGAGEDGSCQVAAGRQPDAHIVHRTACWRTVADACVTQPGAIYDGAAAKHQEPGGHGQDAACHR